MMQQPAVAPLPVPPQQQPSNPMHGLYAGSENWDTAPGWLQRGGPAGPRAGTPNDQALADAMYGRNPAGAAPVQQPGMVEAAEQELLRRRLDERNAGIAAEMQANPDFGSWRPANEPPWHDAARAGQFPYDQGPAVTPHGAVVPRTRVGGSPGYQGAAPGVAPVGQTSMNPPSGIPVTDEELRRGPVRGASWQPVLPGAAQAMALGMAGVQAPILAAQEEARRRAEMLPEEMAASRERVGVGQTPAAKLTVEQEDAMRARHRRLRDERHARLYAPEDLRQMLLLSKRTGAPPEALAGARIAGALGSGSPLSDAQEAFALGQNAPYAQRLAAAAQIGAGAMAGGQPLPPWLQAAFETGGQSPAALSPQVTAAAEEEAEGDPETFERILIKQGYSPEDAAAERQKRFPAPSPVWTHGWKHYRPFAALGKAITGEPYLVPGYSGGFTAMANPSEYAEQRVRGNLPKKR